MAAAYASASVVDGRVYVVRDRRTITIGAATACAWIGIPVRELWNFPPDAMAGDHSCDDASGEERGSLFRRQPWLVQWCLPSTPPLASEIWRHSGPISLISFLRSVLESGRVYLAYTDGTVEALDAANGQIDLERQRSQAGLIRRRQSLAGACISPFIIAGCWLSTLTPVPHSGSLPCRVRNGPRPPLITDGSLSARAMITRSTPSMRSPDKRFGPPQPATGCTRRQPWQTASFTLVTMQATCTLSMLQSGGSYLADCVRTRFRQLKRTDGGERRRLIASGKDDSGTRFDGKLYALDAATGQVLFSAVVQLGTGRGEVGRSFTDS